MNTKDSFDDEEFEPKVISVFSYAPYIQAEFLRNLVKSDIEEMESIEEGRELLRMRFINAYEIKHLVSTDAIREKARIVQPDNLDVFIGGVPKNGYTIISMISFLLIPESQATDLLGEIVDEGVKLDEVLAKVRIWTLREVFEDAWFFKVPSVEEISRLKDEEDCE